MSEETEDIWYSGSPERFDRFHRRIGRTFGTDASEVPIFLTRDPKFAELYAGAHGYIYTVHPNVEQTFNARSFVTDDRYWPPPREALTEEGQKFFDDLVDNRIFPELIRYGTKHEDDDEWTSMHDSAGTYASIFRRDYDVMETTEMKRWMIANGYDSFFVSGDGPDDNLAVFDPEKIEIVSIDSLSEDANQSREMHESDVSRNPPYLSLSIINRFVPLARELGVSAVARGSGGFLPAYRRAGGNPDRLSDHWADKRDAFVARHMAQVKAHGEPLWEDGLPTRRHLALIMWAYSPNPSKLSKI